MKKSKYTTEELVNKFLSITDNDCKKITFKEKTSTFIEIENQYLDNSKLMSVIGNYNSTNIVDGLHKTIDEYKKWFNVSK